MPLVAPMTVTAEARPPCAVCGARSLALLLPVEAPTKGSTVAVAPGVVRAADPRLAPFESGLALIVRRYWFGEPSTRPFTFAARFSLRRPERHYFTTGDLRPDAPHRCTKAKDTEKMTRAMLDAVQGIVYVNDGQVDEQHTRKQWSPTREGWVWLRFDEMHTCAFPDTRRCSFLL